MLQLYIYMYTQTARDNYTWCALSAALSTYSAPPLMPLMDVEPDCALHNRLIRDCKWWYSLENGILYIRNTVGRLLCEKSGQDVRSQTSARWSMNTKKMEKEFCFWCTFDWIPVMHIIVDNEFCDRTVRAMLLWGSGIMREKDSPKRYRITISGCHRCNGWTKNQIIV